MLGFILFSFYFFLSLVAFELQRSKTEHLQARDYELTTDRFFDFIASHLFLASQYFFHAIYSMCQMGLNNVSTRIPVKHATSHILLCFCYQDILE